MKRLVFVLMLVASALISGCASVPMASGERDAQAKSFATKPGKANLYVYRNETFGAAVKLHLDVDGKSVASTAAKTYVTLELDPGKHTLVSKGENDSVLDLNTEAGRNYFVWQEVKMGLFAARSQLQLVDEATGKAGVAECKLIETGGRSATDVARGQPVNQSMPASQAVANETQPLPAVRTASTKESQVSVSDEAGNVIVQKVEFRPGVSSSSVERLAKRFGCTGTIGAGLITEKGPVEVYRMKCDNGTTFMAQCELRQCRPMR